MNRLAPFLALLISVMFTALSQASALESHFEHLKSKKVSEKMDALNAIATTGDPQAETILNQMLEGKLYYIKSTGEFVYIEKGDDKKYTAYSALTNEVVGSFKKRKLKKIRVNNQIRGEIRTALAAIQLTSPDPELRLQAVRNLRDALNPNMLPALKKSLAREETDKITSALETTIAAIEFANGDIEVQLASSAVLADSDDPKILALFKQTLDKTAKPSDLASAIEKSIEIIESRQQLYGVAENLFFGLSAGSVLLLSAIGLAITFGVMGVINMAHGEMMMIGAYTTFGIQVLFPNFIDYSLFIAIPAAFLVSGLVGILIERTVIRHLYGRPLETLLATFGISLVLQQAVRTFVSPQNQSVENPGWMSGSLEITESFALTYNRLYIILFSLVIFFALMGLLKKSLFGLQMRAVTQNRAMANSMGIRSGWVDALTFGLGSGVAGIAGVALSQITNVGPNLGQNYIIDSFMVVVFGGVGNLWGTLVAAMGLGVVNKLIEPWAGAVLAKIIVLVFIILFIQRRPRGLFALKGRAVEG
ncbi:urea ABC transporter permease subunit UrtB [Litoribacillus peritrichatus]|uniref:Urea ABC transporter permease subunit UrtB n=1 Tax=Litoribacillus peritrichatus TaxID=718191 RepID=A0ABP7MPA0_9GAMM